MWEFSKAIGQIDKEIKPDKSFDIIKRELIIGEKSAVLYFIDGFIKDEVYEKILEFWFGQKAEDIEKISDMQEFSKLKMPYVETGFSYDIKFIATTILSGPSVLIIDGVKGALIIDTRTYPMRGIEEPIKDKSLRGSRDGFVETFVMNTAMIRRRIRDSRLRMEYMQIGRKTKLDIAISYIEGAADEKILKILRNKLENITVDGISMTQQALAEKLTKTLFINPFPKFKFTERPDYASACILDGRIALVMDNSPTVMIIPITLADFFRETDDYYFQPIVASYTRIVRMLVAFLNVVLTPIYLLMANNPDLVPRWLEVIMPNKRGEVHLFWQFIILELLIDGLRLASINTPDSLSSSLGIIGGLLLSEFAVSAGWFTGEAILLMAFIAIAGFSLPSFEMGYAMKFERLFLLILTQILGFFGLVGGIGITFVSMLFIKTVSGRNYLYPLIPFNPKAFSELFIRYPMK